MQRQIDALNGQHLCHDGHVLHKIESIRNSFNTNCEYCNKSFDSYSGEIWKCGNDHLICCNQCMSVSTYKKYHFKIACYMYRSLSCSNHSMVKNKVEMTKSRSIFSTRAAFSDFIDKNQHGTYKKLSNYEKTKERTDNNRNCNISTDWTIIFNEWHDDATNDGLLMKAFRMNSDRVARLILENGANPHIINVNDNCNLLLIACKNGNMNLLQLLHAYNFDFKGFHNQTGVKSFEFGANCFLILCKYEFYDCLQFLLDISLAPFYNNLYRASLSSSTFGVCIEYYPQRPVYLETSPELLKFNLGDVLFAGDETQWNVFHHAVNNGHLTTIAFLLCRVYICNLNPQHLPANATRKMYVRVSGANDKKKIKEYKEKTSILLNQYNAKGYTPMHLVCFDVSEIALKIFQLLVHVGCNLHVPGRITGEYPIHILCQTNNWLILNYIISKKLYWKQMINQQKCDDQKYTPLMIAIRFHNVEIVKLLCQCDECDIDTIRNHHRYSISCRTALELASFYGNSESLKVLLTTMLNRKGILSAIASASNSQDIAKIFKNEKIKEKLTKLQQIAKDGFKNHEKMSIWSDGNVTLLTKLLRSINDKNYVNVIKLLGFLDNKFGLPMVCRKHHQTNLIINDNNNKLKDKIICSLCNNTNLINQDCYYSCQSCRHMFCSDCSTALMLSNMLHKTRFDAFYHQITKLEYNKKILYQIARLNENVLFWLARFDKLDLLSTFLKSDSSIAMSINSVFSKHNDHTLLYIASWHGNLKLFKLLKEYNFDFEKYINKCSKESHGWSSFMWLCWFDYFDCLKHLINICFNEYPNIVINVLQTAKDSHQNALHLVVRRQNLSMLEYLLPNLYFNKSNSNYNQGKKALQMKDKQGNIPLHAVCGIHTSSNENGHDTNLAICKLLIEYGSDCTIFDNSGWLPIHLTCFQSNRVNILQYMIDVLETSHQYTQNSKYNIINCLSKNDDLKTPLMIAIKNENIQGVKILCKCKDVDILNIKCKNENNHNAIEYASYLKNGEILKLLLRTLLQREKIDSLQSLNSNVLFNTYGQNSATLVWNSLFNNNSQSGNETHSLLNRLKVIAEQGNKQRKSSSNNDCLSVLNNLINNGIKQNNYNYIAAVLDHNAAEIELLGIQNQMQNNNATTVSLLGSNKTITTTTLKSKHNDDMDRKEHGTSQMTIAKPDNVMQDKKVDDKWWLMDRLGEGKFGIVYKGLDCETGELVAIKFIQPNRYDPKKLSLKKSIVQEIESLKQISHPNIIQLLHYNTKTNCDYKNKKNMHNYEEPIMLVFEYAALTLREVLQVCNNKRLSHQLSKTYFEQLLSGLEICHTYGIIHRDLKLSNLLVDAKTCQLKIADFGLSKVMNNDNDNFMNNAGTKGYTCPEMFTADEHIQKMINKHKHMCDIFSSGVVLWNLIYGVDSMPFNQHFDAIKRFPDEKYQLIIEKKFNQFWRSFDFSDFNSNDNEEEQKLNNCNTSDNIGDDCNINNIHWLLENMFEYDPSKRITIEQIRKSEWFTNTTSYNTSKYRYMFVLEMKSVIQLGVSSKEANHENGIPNKKDPVHLRIFFSLRRATICLPLSKRLICHCPYYRLTTRV